MPSGAHPQDRKLAELSHRVATAQQRICGIYRLDLELRAQDFLLPPAQAREQLGKGAPETGLVALEEGEDLWLGIYFDPSDRDDSAAILEETSHWLAVVWHAQQRVRISPLVLEFQAEVDRYAVARTAGVDPLRHFSQVRWLPGRPPDEAHRYRTAHAAAYRYCRRLERRYPQRCDMPGLLRELRRFYRCYPEQKLAA